MIHSSNLTSLVGMGFLALTACLSPFDPAFDSVACGPDSSCPPGYICKPDAQRCERPDGVEPVEPEVIDASTEIPDAPIVTMNDAYTTYTPSNFDPEGLTPAGDLVIDCETMFDSADRKGTWCDASPLPMIEERSGYMIVVSNDFSITQGAKLTITGDRPVIFAVFGNAQLDGMLDVSATGTTPGPGGGPVNEMCSQGMGGAGGQATGGGGGGGGGFGGNGANGGNGGDSTNSGGVGGPLGGAPALVPLRGGCSGQSGGAYRDPEDTLVGGADGGGGGGAVQISASGLIAVQSTIAAAGGGGAGGTLVDGGGGGGSGGGILLEGDRVILTDDARVTANGGGGGQGGDNTGSAEQPPGNDGQKSSNEVALGGMSGSGAGGAGGSGGTNTDSPMPGDPGQAGNGGALDGGGGGGGGGVGRIRINAVTSCIIAEEAVVSPPASTGSAMNCAPDAPGS